MFGERDYSLTLFALGTLEVVSGMKVRMREIARIESCRSRWESQGKTCEEIKIRANNQRARNYPEHSFITGSFPVQFDSPKKLHCMI